MQLHGWPLCYARCQIWTSGRRIHLCLSEMLNLSVGGFRKSYMVDSNWTMSYTTAWWSPSGRRGTKIRLPAGGLSLTLQKFWTLYLKDWVQSWQKLAFSSQKIKYYVPGRSFHHPDRECHSSWEIINFRREDWAPPSKVMNFLVVRLSSELADTNSFRPEDSVLFA